MIDDKKCWTERRSGDSLERPRSGYRDPYGRDKGRIIHSSGFRRLQAKTQVLGIGEGDFHRTRLTHSVEAAQVSRGIARYLEKAFTGSEWQEYQQWRPSFNLLEAICLAHDIGHPPFGHGGEVALNFVMRRQGGFEGNGQTLRTLARLEAHTPGYGLDLTRRALLGVLKYPVPFEAVCKTKLPSDADRIRVRRGDWKPPKCFMKSEKEVVDWTLIPFEEADRRGLSELSLQPSTNKHGKSKHRSLDTCIMEMADDVAYGVHDLEDAIALRLIGDEDWLELEGELDPKWGQTVEVDSISSFAKKLFSKSSDERKRAIGALVNAFIVSSRPTRIDGFTHALLRFQCDFEEPARVFLQALKDLVNDKVIQTPQVQTLEYRGQQMIMALFEAIESDPERLLKDKFKDQYKSATDEADQKRIICDYIAGMTDEYATRMYERMFIPRQGHVFDRL